MTGTSGPTDKTGTIATTETWGLDESPFIITGDITLSADVDIYVEAGVEIRVEKEDAVINLGSNSIFEFGGTKEMPIRVHGATELPGYWGGFRMASTMTLRAKFTTFSGASNMFGLLGQETLVLENCIVEYCVWGIGFEEIAQPTSVLFRHNIFRKNHIAWYGKMDLQATTIYRLESDKYFVDNEFTENEWAIAQQDTGIDLIGRDNRFYRNRRGALWVNAAGTGTIDLEDNWWGSDSGPEESSGNPNGTGDLILNEGSTTIDYEPFTRLGQYVPIVDDLREFVNRMLREGTPSGEESLATIVDDDELGRFLRRAERTFDSWHTDEFLEKTLFGYGEETNEARDRHSHDVSFYKLRYRPIIAISLLERRTGTSSWSTVNENEISGYYSSEAERRRGQVFLALITTLFERDTIRVTYTHGYLDIPEEIRDIVIKIAALEAFQAILRVGEEDVFADRLAALQAEIEWSRDNLRR